MKEDSKLIATKRKRADKSRHKLIIPKKFVEEHGLNFVMEVYKDKIILIPSELYRNVEGN